MYTNACLLSGHLVYTCIDPETYQWHPTLEQNCIGIEAKSVTGKLTYRHSVLLEKDCKDRKDKLIITKDD